MAVITGALSSATSAVDLYNLIAAALTANPNWSRPTDPTITGATDSLAATATSQVWKCTVGTEKFYVVFTTDTALPNNLYVHTAERYGTDDSLTAKRFARITGGGTLATAADGTSVTPGSQDVVTTASTALSATSPNFAGTLLTLSGSVFSYLFKVTNKTVTIGVRTTVNRWVQVGMFESLVSGPSDPCPVGLFTHGINNLANRGATIGSNAHADGVVTRNPGLGTTAEAGAFFAWLLPLHSGGASLVGTTLGDQPIWPSARGYTGTPPRWHSRVLMSQAIVHQSLDGSGPSTGGQSFRGYYPDLFACHINGTTEPLGGGVDSVVIDGVTYYWLGINCPGVQRTTIATGMSILVAVRAD